VLVVAMVGVAVGIHVVVTLGTGRVSDDRRLHDGAQCLPVAGVDVGDRRPDRVGGDLQPTDVDGLVHDVAGRARVVRLVDEVVPLDVVVAGQMVGERVVLLPLQPQPGPRPVPPQLGRLHDRGDAKAPKLSHLVVELVVVRLAVDVVLEKIFEDAPTQERISFRIAAQQRLARVEVLHTLDARSPVERLVWCPLREGGEKADGVDPRVLEPR
jgi:hypothetical protein